MTTENFTCEKNIVYGMYGGTALLGDLYRPASPNGLGLVHISGSGWHRPRAYDAPPLKESGHVKIFVHPLASAGFTVFTINHRAAPLFQYPAAVEDAQRAVRFFRHHAESYGIQPDKIGLIGGSSGGHLVSMVATLASAGQADHEDPVERESSAVQCVVARAPLIDLTQAANSSIVVAFMGHAKHEASDALRYQQASPLYHVSDNTPPFLLLHGTADTVVHPDQSRWMLDALHAKNIPTRLIEVAEAGHGPSFPGATAPVNLIPDIMAWFKAHL